MNLNNYKNIKHIIDSFEQIYENASEEHQNVLMNLLDKASMSDNYDEDYYVARDYFKEKWKKE